MKEVYEPVQASFRAEIEKYIQNQKFTSIQYFSDIREYVSTTAIIKGIYEHDGAEYMQLATGTEIRLDRIIRLDGKPAPGFEDYFACEC